MHDSCRHLIPVGILLLPLLPPPFLRVLWPALLPLLRTRQREEERILYHQGEREFAPIPTRVILPSPSLCGWWRRDGSLWVVGAAFAEGQHGRRMPLGRAVLATAPLTQPGCRCPSSVLVSRPKKPLIPWKALWGGRSAALRSP